MPTIVVGVQPDQSEAVLQQAARLAGSLDAVLVCAWVDGAADAQPLFGAEGASFAAGVSVAAMPVPEEAEPRRFDPALQERVAQTLAPFPVHWRTEYRSGEPAASLARLADEEDAVMIVLGTSEAGIGRAVHDFLGGSVAVQLAHRQQRPLLWVPSPIPDDVGGSAR